jgi:hypothetical protein
MPLTTSLARVAASAALVVAVLPARAALAQSDDPMRDHSTAPSTRPVRVGFGGGVLVPRQGASEQSIERGIHGQGFVLLRLPAGLPALRANVDVARLRFDTPGTATTPGVDGHRSLLAGVLGMKVDLLRGPVRPYLLAGAGAFSIRDAIDGAAGGSASQVSFGLDGGAGVALRLGGLDAFVETRLQNVYTRERGLVDTKSIAAFPVTFGVIF